jgi:Tat protein translocase TatB subunit
VFGIGWTEFVLVALVLLIFVGPKHLPGMLKKFVEIIGELKSASREFRNQIEEEIGDVESPSKIVRDVGRDLIQDMPSPYEEMHNAEQATQKEVQRELDEIEDGVTKKESDNIENTSSKGVSDKDEGAS